MFLQVPAFEGSDGLLLTESNAIAYYVASEELRGGAEAAARAQVSPADGPTWEMPVMSDNSTNRSLMKTIDTGVHL